MNSIQDKYLFVTLKRDSFSKIDEFIKSWSAAYSYLNMELYSDIIYKEVLEAKDLESLFIWKNGMPLSDKKNNSFQAKILEKISVINSLRVTYNKEVFEETFKNLTSVWKIFLLHIIKPEEYPIFDQHVYRAFKYIVDQVADAEIPLYDKKRMKIYYDEYLPFYLHCKEEMDECFTSKQLDDALWAFGKFLKEYPRIVL